MKKSILQAFRTQKEARLLRHIGVAAALVIIAIVISYLFVDPAIAYFFKGREGPLQNMASFVSFFIDPYWNVFIWPVLYFIVRFLMGKEKAGNALLLILIAVAISIAVGHIFKFVFGRFRPEELFVHGAYGFDWFSFNHEEGSFPSGHAAVAGAIMGCLSCLNPRFTYQYLGTAVFISFSRVILNAHYFSDILAGVLLGALIAQMIYVLIKRKMHNLGFDFINN